MPVPTSSTAALANLGNELVGRALDVSEEEPVTLIGLSVSNLTTDQYLQLELQFDSGDVLRAGSFEDLRHRSLDDSVDAVRERFGKGLVRLGLTGGGSSDEFRRLAEKS